MKSVDGDPAGHLCSSIDLPKDQMPSQAAQFVGIMQSNFKYFSKALVDAVFLIMI